MSLIFASLRILFGGVVILCRGSYFGELAISFLPHLSIISFLGLLFRVFQLWKFLYKEKQKKSLKRRLSPLFVLCFWILFGCFLRPIKQFYQPLHQLNQSIDSPIKVLFSNIYMGNNNIDAIKKMILDENPDVVLFVEFSEEHSQALKDFFATHYPYSNTTSRSKIAVGSIVFSKYPIDNLADDFPQASWRYGYFSIDTEKWKYYFYEIHTASPVSNAFFEKRNQQLKQIKSDFFTHHQSQRESNAKIIMLGDFNTSPRSAYYADFAGSFSGTLENITKTFPILFTRNLWEMLNVHKDFSFLPLWIRKAWGYFPFFQSHIDHVFLSPNLKFKNLKKIQIPGSDHSGFIFEIE